MTTTDFLSKPYATEDQLTAHCHLFINNNFPCLRNFYFHIPNELSMVKGETQNSFSMRLQRHMACGVLPGVFDLCFQLPFTWYLELKMPGKCFSKAQSKLATLWRGIGLNVELCDTKQLVLASLLKHCGEFYKPL